MKSYFVKMLCNYGPFKKGGEYKVIAEGYDFKVMTHKGHPYNVSDHLIDSVYDDEEETLLSYEEIEK